MNRGRHYKNYIIYTCLFLSGSAGLAYEILWARILGLSFGHTVYAITTVLVSFMGGLALGSHIFGKVSDKVKRPLLLYGYLEAGIGIYCLATPYLLGLAREVYLFLYPLLGYSQPIKIGLQFGFSCLVLIVPTTLMGGTLPVVVRGSVSDFRQTGLSLSLLYGVNTLGAATGAFLAGYWALPTLGISLTNRIGVVINLIVGLVVILISRSADWMETGPEIANNPSGELTSQLPVDPAVRRALLWGIALSGTTALLYQITWTRALILVIGTSTYAFSAIVVTFLFGLALGSYLLSRIPSGQTPGAFALLQLFIGASALFLVPLFSILPRLFLFLFKGYGGNYFYIQMLQFAIVAVVVLVPTVFMGMTLPCVTGIISRDTERVGSDTGRIFALNTTGAIIGSLVTGFLLISAIGVQKTLILAIIVNLSLASWVALAALGAKKQYVLPALAATAILLIFLPNWNRGAMVSGVSVSPDSYYVNDTESSKTPRHNQWKIAFFREGISSTVAVTMDPDGLRTLRVNGRPEAGSISRDIETFIKLAYLPTILHSDPQRIVVIGLGGGITAYTTTRFTEPERIDVVEIDPTVAKALEYFSPGDLNATTDERVNLVVEDGRTFLEGNQTLYDVIICAPSQLRVAGVANLFTVEFFKTARQRLAEGGILCLWVQGYKIEPQDFSMVVRTLREVFPEISLWEGTPLDYILIASKDKLQSMDINSLSSRLRKNDQLIQFLKDQDDMPIESLLTSFRLGADDLKKFSGSGTVNTDDLNSLEFSTPKSFYTPGSDQIRFSVESYRTADFPSFITDPRLTTDQGRLRLAIYLIRKGKFQQALWETSRVKPLRPFIPDVKIADIARFPEAADTLTEDFGGENVLPHYPLVGGYKPDELDALEKTIWDTYHEFFKRVSGIKDGVGIDGTPALVIGSHAEAIPLAFTVPLKVEGDSEYQVEFKMKNQAGENVEVGMGYMEYDTVIPLDPSFTISVHEKHLIGGEKAIAFSGPSPWRSHEYSFKTAPGARMIHLNFFRFGDVDSGETTIDDISIRKLTTKRDQIPFQ